MVNMASKFLSNDQQNFTRMGVACVDEIKLVLKDILETQIAPKDLYNRICLCPELTNGSQRLRPDQKKLCFLSPPSVPDYVKFDVSLLYTLIRNLCQSLKPPQGWGKTPTPTDVQIGDDIERLRLFRNEMFGHLSSSDISDDKFSSQWKELEIIIKRAQTFVMSQGRAVNYEEKLAFIKRSKFGFEDMDRYKILLEGFLQLFKQTEDFPDIKIRGKNKILCGDKACFEAEIGNCQESTCLRFTWQKLKGNTIEQIDINSEKFKGSTYSQLVLQRVLKEDGGEYQAAVLREVNGRSLVIPSNKIYLQVFGDPPRVEILQISSETEYITIHYSCAEDVLPSIDQIRWMKNGELLRLNSTKYNGGGVEDKYLQIFSPTEEDGGEYICTVSNALESVTKSIQLGVPMAQLPEFLKSPFGGQVIIEPVIKSCPPVKTVVWQISEDQNSENFKAIDVTYRRYFGSTLDPQKPVLVIPKVSYEDRMYYRIQVSNGIGNSWSNATLLKIDGDIPSVFLNHETNFLEQKVSLLCNVVLTENSPKVAEVLWTKDKKPLDISGCGAKYSGGTVSDPTLIINRVNSNDSGEYQCNVSNAVGNMSSCPLCLAPPCIDVHIPRLENDEEGEKLVCTCTVRSIPEAKAVEWSIQQRPEDGFKTIDVYEPTYIGSTVSLPYPVLIVHKYKPTSPQIFHIKVTNFIGETTTSIQGKPHKTEDTFLGSEEVELVEKDIDTVIKAESIREILQILRQKNMFCPKDVLFLQCLLRKIGCVELCNKCSNYAKRCKALCFFENQPENGYKHVSFHIVGNVEDYSKEDLLHIQNIVADMLGCSTEFVSIDGLRPSESFVVVVAIKQKYIDKLLARAQKILVHLCDLNVDYLVCDGVKIFRQESASLENEVTLETFEYRSYQNELAEPAQRGKNCIITAPTGSGKTIVAVKIIKHHLQANLSHKVKKIAFVVDKSNLANQQSDAIKRFVTCRLKVISGDTMREEEFTQLSALLPQYDIFVITAQMLVNAMDKEDLSIESFTLLIFDECHHCHGGHAFYKTMVPYHDKMLSDLSDLDDQKFLPQIVGLTASIGVGNAKTSEQTVSHVKTMMANLDADVLVSVQINTEELARKINTPDQCILKIPTRKIDEFGARIQSLMIKTERYLKEVEDKIADKTAVNPPAKKGNEQYTQWLQNVLLPALAQISDQTLSCSFYTARKYLQIYNDGLIMHSNVRASDSLKTITEKIEELPKPSSELDQHIKLLFENEKSNLQVCAIDNRQTEENPLLLKLKDIIVDTYQTEENMRGIIFVRTRQLADILVNWMRNTKELINIRAKTCTGSQAKRSEGGMTKNKQKDTIDLFKKGDFKLIVATTIAEEGLDIKECNLIVKYDYAGNPISQIQAKGRGRADNSRFFILASEDKCVAEREWINSEKGPMMDEAMAIVQQETQTNYEKFQIEKRELQRLAKMQREAAASNNDMKETPSGQYVLRCLKCKMFLCVSSEMRKLGSHYACINGDLKSRVICKKSKNVGYKGDDMQMGLGILECKNIKCREKLGVIALYKEVHFPILQIKSLQIEDDMKRGDTVKKWKKVEEKYFTVAPISPDDLQKISETGKLLNFD